eukprot:5879082-Pleurochrysis_carterae.AAC.2
MLARPSRSQAEQAALHGPHHLSELRVASSSFEQLRAASSSFEQLRAASEAIEFPPPARQSKTSSRQPPPTAAPDARTSLRLVDAVPSPHERAPTRPNSSPPPPT